MTLTANHLLALREIAAAGDTGVLNLELGSRVATTLRMRGLVWRERRALRPGLCADYYVVTDEGRFELARHSPDPPPPALTVGRLERKGR